MCKVSSVGRASVPAGVAPEALEECLHSSKGYICRPAWLLYWGGRPGSFQPALAFLSAGLGIFRAGAATQSPAEPSGRHALRVGVLVKHVELHNRRLSIHSRVRPEPRCARSPRAPTCVKVFRGPSTFITTLIALLQGGGVKRTMLLMPGPRAMTASVSCYRVVQVDVRAPFDKGRLVVHGHVT